MSFSDLSNAAASSRNLVGNFKCSKHEKEAKILNKSSKVRSQLNHDARGLRIISLAIFSQSDESTWPIKVLSTCSRPLRYTYSLRYLNSFDAPRLGVSRCGSRPYSVHSVLSLARIVIGYTYEIATRETLEIHARGERYREKAKQKHESFELGDEGREKDEAGQRGINDYEGPM